MGNQSVNPNQSGPTASSSTGTGEGQRRHESRKPRAEFQEEQARVLSASLRHVVCINFIDSPQSFVLLVIHFCIWSFV